MNKKTQAKLNTYKGEIPRKPLAFVWYITKGYWKWGFPAFIAVTVAGILGASGPFLYARIIDSANTGKVDDVFFWTFIFILFSFLIFISWRLSGYLGMRFQLNVERTGHLKLFAYLLGHSQTYFNDRFAGSLSSKVSNGADGAEHLLEGTLWNYYGIFLNLVITFIYIITVSPAMALFFVLATVFIFIVNYLFVKKLIPLVIEYNKSTTRFRGNMVDVLTNISAVKAYSGQKEEQKHLTNLANERFDANIREWRYSEHILLFNNIIVLIIEAILFGSAVYFWAEDMITVGTLIMLFAVFMRVQENLVFIGNNIRSFIRMYGMIEEGLSEILVGQDLVDKTDAQDLMVPNGEIAWKNVDFTYGEQAVFSDFSLTIKPGERIGLVGASGAGKTTFVSLLLRQHEIDTGAVLIDGQNIAEVTQDSLRENIAVVPQEPLLFHRTIRENILYGNPHATEKEMISAAKSAQAHEFILQLSLGYDTMVGERGVKLSGGQKQRVAIARAMLKDAPILILDEATSALDSESEVAIQKALHTLMEGKTVIAIAHRLSTLREMDRIIVLENGVVTEDGPHDVLVTKKGQYARLWKHQAGGFLTE